MAEFKAELKYTHDHDWVKVDGDVATVGITDFAQNALGDIVFVEVPEVGDSIEKGGNFGVVESIKSVTDLESPLSGEVIEANEELSDAPESCNQDAFSAWIMKIKISNPAELDELMSVETYKTHCDNQ
ncbi:MAG: glycine cleavage system protein GcvH [Bacteriovoracaceae bacterium]|nr:glycine cleavage system protein GcvH [Bacteriovoracaceae bacterium]